MKRLELEEPPHKRQRIEHLVRIDTQHENSVPEVPEVPAQKPDIKRPDIDSELFRQLHAFMTRAKATEDIMQKRTEEAMKRRVERNEYLKKIEQDQASPESTHIPETTDEGKSREDVKLNYSNEHPGCEARIIKLKNVRASIATREDLIAGLKRDDKDADVHDIERELCLLYRHELDLVMTYFPPEMKIEADKFKTSAGRFAELKKRVRERIRADKQKEAASGPYIEMDLYLGVLEEKKENQNDEVSVVPPMNVMNRLLGRETTPKKRGITELANSSSASSDQDGDSSEDDESDSSFDDDETEDSNASEDDDSVESTLEIEIAEEDAPADAEAGLSELEFDLDMEEAMMEAEMAILDAELECLDDDIDVTGRFDTADGEESADKTPYPSGGDER